MKSFFAVKTSLILCILISCFGFGPSANAQRIAYMNLEDVLKSVEDYTNAQTEINNLAEKWQGEIDEEREKVKSMYNRFQAEQVLWSEEMKAKKEQEIIDQESKVREMYEQRFGPEGALFKKRQELIRPIQEKIYAIIENYATERGYDFIFDVNSAAGLLYTNSKYDKTEDIIRRVRY